MVVVVVPTNAQGKRVQADAVLTTHMMLNSACRRRTNTRTHAHTDDKQTSDAWFVVVGAVVVWLWYDGVGRDRFARRGARHSVPSSATPLTRDGTGRRGSTVGPVIRGAVPNVAETREASRDRGRRINHDHFFGAHCQILAREGFKFHVRVRA